MTTRPHRIIFAALALALALGLASCQSGTQKVDTKMTFTSPIAFRLPPDPIWTVNATALVLPAQTPAPSIRTANCFAGVPNDLDFGIGASIGVTRTYLGVVILPVNINLGARHLGAFRIRVTVADPAVTIDATPAGITGSNPQLSVGNCLLRGCPSNCGTFPLSFPNEYSPAPGFQHVDTITPGAGFVTVETVNNDLVNPTTGIVNLCNLRILVAGDLPPTGVNLVFTVERLEDSTGADISAGALPINGIIIEHFQLN